jgi:hypothetical protein
LGACRFGEPHRSSDSLDERKPDWSFDESGFCVEIDDHEVELCRDIVSKYLR